MQMHRGCWSLRNGCRVVIWVVTMSAPGLKHKLWMAWIALCIGLMSASMPKFFREMESTKWTPVPGEIARSYVRTGYWKSVEGFIPAVQYRYRVGVRDYW